LSQFPPVDIKPALCLSIPAKEENIKANSPSGPTGNPSVVKKASSFFTTTLPLFCLAHFGHHLMTALPALLLPFIREDSSLTGDKLSNSQVAWVSTAFSLAYGLGQLPGGWLADRIGRRIMIGIGVFGVALAGILIGLSTSFMLLLILLVVMGILGGGYHPAATPWISASAGEKNTGRAIGFHFLGGGSGFFVAPFIGGAVAAALGWHWAFIVMAIPCAVFGIVFFFILSRQKDANLKSVAGTHHNTAGGSINRWTPLITLIVMSFITGTLGTVMTFFSLYLIDDWHVSKQTAVFVMAISSFAGIWAGPVGGWISDRVGRLPLIIATSFVGGLIIFLIRWIPYGPLLFAVLLISGINMYVGSPVSEAFIMGQTSARNRSLIYGVYYAVGLMGSLFLPLVGSLIDRYHYGPTFMIAGIASMIATLIGSSILLANRKQITQPANTQS
jgi:MFS family permease